MEEECYCNSFDRKENYFSKFLKMFNIIASSNIKREKKTSNIAYTIILKCKKCNSYYIWDSHSEEYYDNNKISAKKYSPKTDDDGLRKILRDFKGFINEQEIDEYSQLLGKLRKIELKRDYQIDINENKN
jgi:hypothetical protein